jgi:hypothetical protein
MKTAMSKIFSTYGNDQEGPSKTGFQQVQRPLVFFFLALFSLGIFSGCEDDNELVAITAFEVLDPVVTANGFQTGGRLVANKEINILEYGICYGTSSAPTIENNVVPGTGLVETWEQSQFTAEFSSLVTIISTPGTTIYIRAFITTKTGTAYSRNERVFTSN